MNERQIRAVLHVKENGSIRIPIRIWIGIFNLLADNDTIRFITARKAEKCMIKEYEQEIENISSPEEKAVAKLFVTLRRYSSYFSSIVIIPAIWNEIASILSRRNKPAKQFVFS